MNQYTQNEITQLKQELTNPNRTEEQKAKIKSWIEVLKKCGEK